jgi:hypothetical protein
MENLKVVEMPQQAKLSDELLHNAVQNDYNKSFELGGREFQLKDLAYDDYVLFVKLASPLVESVIGVVQPVLSAAEDGSPELIKDFKIDMSAIDVDTMADMAGHNLPIMAHLVCKQSAPQITLNEVKELAMSRKNKTRGPFAMLEIVLRQVAHNKLIEEFAEFFPRLGSLVGDLVPSLTAVAQMAESKTEATRS